MKNKVPRKLKKELCKVECIEQSAEDAERAKKLLKKKHKGGTKWYKCDYCGQYHLTSIKKQRKGKMRF